MAARGYYKKVDDTLWKLDRKWCCYKAKNLREFKKISSKHTRRRLNKDF